MAFILCFCSQLFLAHDGYSGLKLSKEYLNGFALRSEARHWSGNEEELGFIVRNIGLRYSVWEPESLKLGLGMYLQDRQARNNKLNGDELSGLFGVLFDKPGYRWLPFFDVSGKDVPFFQKIALSNWIPFHGKKLLMRGESGSTFSTVRVNNSHHEYFFKRFLGGSDVLIGKKMAAETAAFELSTALGYSFVPRTRFVKFEGKTGTLQDAVPHSFVQGSTLPDLNEILRHPGFSNRLSDLKVFDYIGSFSDRHFSNVFFHLDDFLIQGIDHESGFHLVIPRIPSSAEFISGGILPEFYTDHTRRKLDELSFAAVKSALAKTATSEQIEAVWLRMMVVKADIIRKYGTLLPEGEGEA